MPKTDKLLDHCVEAALPCIKKYFPLMTQEELTIIAVGIVKQYHNSIVLDLGKVGRAKVPGFGKFKVVFRKARNRKIGLGASSTRKAYPAKVVVNFKIHKLLAGYLFDRLENHFPKKRKVVPKVPKVSQEPPKEVQKPNPTNQENSYSKLAWWM